MSSVYQRYEASVKLSNGRVVVYHNINTGLKKFHRFLCEKFETPDRWISYVVRRKIDKEIVGRYRNSVAGTEQKVVNIFVKTIENDKKTGVFVPMIFERNGYEIPRNMFVVNKMIFNRNSLLISLPEWLFEKMIANGKRELYEYYLKENHQIQPNEIILSRKMYFSREKITTPSTPATEPEQDYP